MFEIETNCEKLRCDFVGCRATDRRVSDLLACSPRLIEKEIGKESQQTRLHFYPGGTWPFPIRNIALQVFLNYQFRSDPVKDREVTRHGT